MRIFNKMKKTMLVLAASLFCVGSVFADSKTFLLHGGNMTVGTDADGYSTMTGNAGAEAEGVVITLLNSAKAWSTHNSITVDGQSLSTIKVSNGAQNSCTLPEGYVATKVTLYSYVNINEAKKADNIAAEKYLPNGYRTSYWKEFAGTAYTEETATIMATFIDGDLTAPDAISFDVDKVSSFTFTNTGEQACFVMKIEAEEVTAEEEVPAVDSLSVDEVNILEVGKTYILGEASKMYKVQFTAEKDGFFSLTPSQTVRSTGLKINNASSTFTKDANGGVEKKGMAAGSIFTGTYYITGTPSAENTYSFTVSFEEGVPYTALSMTTALPADGTEWSGAAVYYTTYSSYQGQPYYDFSSAINTTDIVASVKIGEKTYTPIKVSAAKNGVVLKSLPDTLSTAIADGLIKAGETFTVTLSNIKDKEFAANTLADQTFTYTLASTACTGAESDASTTKYPTYVTFTFDGNVTIDNAKFYLVDLFTNETTNLTGEVVENTSVKITVPAVEGLPSRRYKVVAENVTDANGKAISYTNDATNCPKEEGKLLFVKFLNNGFFNNGKTVSLSTSSWSEGYTQMYSLKSFTITFPAPVVRDEAITDEVVITKEAESSGDDDISWWNEGGETTDEGTETDGSLTVSHAISETDPCTVVFTLSQELTAVGKYTIQIPTKLYWAKDYYSTDTDSLNNFGYYLPGTTAYAEIIERTAIDVTDKLVNPNFDDATANTGWTAGSITSLGFGTSSAAVALKDGSLFVGNIVEHWESGNWTGDIAQTVTGLPAGAYKFTMGAYVNNAGEAHLFANDSTSIGIEAAKAGEYAVYVEVAEGADLKVGVNNVSGINWVVIDNAHLYYYGEGSTVAMALEADWKAVLAAVADAKAAYAAPVGVEALDAVVAAAKIGTDKELLASVKAVNEAIEVFKQANALNMIATATKADSIDVSFLIVNPNANNNVDGWTLDGNTNMRIMSNEHYSNVTNPYFDTNNWNDAIVGSMKQTITNLPAGVYTLTAVARGNMEEGSVVINDNKVAIEMVGNTDGALGRGWNKYTVSDTLYATGDLTIGLELNNTSGAKWFSADEFALSAYMCDEVASVLALNAAVDSLNALIVEVEAFQKTLDVADATQASMSESLTQAITGSKAVAEAKESTAAVREAYNSLNMNYVQIKVYLAGTEAQAAQTMMGEYENPTDEAGLATAINKVFEIVSALQTGMGEVTYTVADLDAAVEAMRTAKEAFIVENTPAAEPVVKMTYVDYDQPSTAMGEIAAGESARAGYNKLSGGTVGFGNTGWGENKITYIQVDASCYTGDIVSAKLTVEVSGSSDSKRTTGWGVGYNSSVWSADMTYDSADKTITTMGDQQWTSTKSATTFETKEFDILDAFKNDEDKVVTLVVYETAAAGGYIKNPVVAIEAASADEITTYTVKYVDEAGADIADAFTANIMIGEKAALTADDKANKYNADNTKKYIYVSCDRDSIVTVADSASNVITATFREAATYNYTVEAIDESGNVLATVGTYSNFEGETDVKAPYNTYVLVDATLYEAAKIGKEYNQYIDLTEDNMKVQVTYTKTDIENVVYYQEAENVEGLTLATNANTGIRSSNSASAYAAEADVVLTNLPAGKFTLTAVICDTKKAMDAAFSFIAGADTVLTTASSAVNWSSSTSKEFALTAETAISLAKGGNSMQAVDFVYIQKTGDVASRFDLTAYNDTVAWANEQKATLNAEDESEAEVIAAIDEYIASAAQWLAEVEADPEATQADVDYIAQDLKAQVSAVMSRIQISKLWPEAEALRMEADSVYNSYTNPTDEAGLVVALQSFPRSPMFVTSVEELQAAMDALQAAMEAFIAENNNPVEVTKIAYLNTSGDANDAIYDALVAAGYKVDALAYADVTLSDEIIESELVGYDVVVLGGSTGSSANLAKTANLLLGKVNVLSTKSFWYKHYGVNGGNPGTADTPSLNMAKVAGYEGHPIYAGIEGDEFAVFNDMAKSTGRYLQSNGSFTDGPEQKTLGTTNGENCIGEAWVDGKGYVIIPVDGLQPTGYLTAEGAQLFVNAVEYLVAGEEYIPDGIEGIRVNAAQWPADIYDLSGRMVKKAATSLEGLQKGLYIINGKKVLVK